MTSVTNRLMFFNGEGYPHNFRINDNIWNGKILFEPNSVNLFKSVSMYILESVPTIEYNGTFDLINNELYSDLGMSIFSYTTEQIEVDEIKAVNQSNKFYTKWIYGKRLNKLFPIGTMISFTGNVSNVMYGEGDFISSKFFNVLRTKKDAIMISTTTSNNLFYFVYNKSVHNLKIISHNAISVPSFKRIIPSIYNPDDNMKINIVGSQKNDTIIELKQKVYTTNRIFDYDLYNVIVGDKITLDIELLTERPLLYSGNINLSKEGSILTMEFINGRNSNLEIGTQFIVEDFDGNHLLNSNFYTIQDILKEIYITNVEISFSTNTYVDDDSKVINEYYVTYPNSLNLKINDKIRFDNLNNDSKNDNLIRRILSLKVDEYTTTAKLDDIVYAEVNQSNNIYKVLKDYEQNFVIVTSSIDFSTFPNLQPVRCMSTTNIIRYVQDITIDGLQSSLDSFILRYKSFFNSNCLDIYRMGDILYIEGLYSGQKPYFNSKLYINNIELPIKHDYSDLDGNTDVYNYILKEGKLYNERHNMTEDLARSYYADIIFNLSDDVQDYGFQIQLNGIQFYIEFNDNSGTTSKTYETILSFIDKYEYVFNNNGLDLSSAHITISGNTYEHLYITGQEPNVDVLELIVKVNTNSSFTLNEIKNNRLMIVSNYIESDTFNFINYGYTTSMIVNLYGSIYPSNNGQYNVIGLHNNRLELSYQGAFYTQIDTQLNIKSKEYLRRPRESNEIDIYYRFRWDDDSDTTIFLYDLSGDNLVPYGNNSKLKYTGVKPLNLENDIVFLNKEPNKEQDYVKIPSKQQTIFEQLDFKLDRFDDDEINILPEPIQVFIGYKSESESVNERNLIVERVDNVIYKGYANGVDLYLTFNNNILTLNTTSKIDLLNMGFKKNRLIRIKLDDKKPYTQLLFEDFQNFKILNVTKNQIIIDGVFSTFSTQNEGFDFIIEQLPEQIAFFKFIGQSESEDERLESNMKLLGINLTEEHEYIFEESNIKEEGNDYILLNRKRKEMMDVYKDIYDYIGSYKAVFNTLNFFGYEDIELVEYYKNIDTNSPLYNKLKQVVIPDLMDTQVDGWSYSEELAKRIGYKKTNLLNLTYRITDEEGNNVYLYTLAEVQYKLNGLKKWLRNNILPINTNIKDITGVSESVGTVWTKYNSANNIIDHKTSENSTAINFNYIATRNFNTSWIISIRFYTVNGFIPDAFDLKIITYVKGVDGVMKPQQEYIILKTDLEPFNFYINWDAELFDMYFKIETLYFNNNGIGLMVDKMYKLENKDTYYYDELKNYILVENNFNYVKQNYVQNDKNIYVFDKNGNYYTIEK